jgi:hypothetical protein
VKKRGAGKTSSPDSQNSFATNHFCTSPPTSAQITHKCYYENVSGFLFYRPPGSQPSQPLSRVSFPPDSWRKQGDARAGAAADLLPAVALLPPLLFSRPLLFSHHSWSRPNPRRPLLVTCPTSPSSSLYEGAPLAAPSSSFTPGRPPLRRLFVLCIGG